MSRNLFEYHPVIGYRFIPGLTARVRHEGGGYLVRCNQTGFRCDHEVSDAKPPGVFRVLIFGDSFTAGDGVANGKRYTDRIEAQLPGLQVLNFGLPGSGTDQQYLVFREYTKALEYDLLVLAVTVPNIWRILGGEQVVQTSTDGHVMMRPKPYFRLDDGALRLENQPVPTNMRPVSEQELDQMVGKTGGGPIKSLVRKIYQRFPELKGRVQRLRGIRSPIEYDDPSGGPWKLMRAILAEWIKESRAPVLLAPIPAFEHVNRYVGADGYLARFRELGAEKNVQVVDVLPTFWALSAADRKRCRYAQDDHPTEFGHEILARALLPSVQNHFQSRESHHV
jgi:lysophospholipase L1-like esterase